MTTIDFAQCYIVNNVSDLATLMSLAVSTSNSFESWQELKQVGKEAPSSKTPWFTRAVKEGTWDFAYDCIFSTLEVRCVLCSSPRLGLSTSSIIQEVPLLCHLPLVLTICVTVCCLVCNRESQTVLCYLPTASSISCSVPVSVCGSSAQAVTRVRLFVFNW